MKNKRTMTIISLVLLVAPVITSAPEPNPGAPVVFRAERGDTFGNLFVDWQKAYDENRTTVIRNGKPVTSPDILLEGATLRVTGDIRLKPRAIGRVDNLVKRRDALRQRLANLAGAAEPAGIRVGELRHMLEDDLRYAADIDFIEREAAKLETIELPARALATPTWIWATAGVAVAIMLVAGIALARRQEDAPSGDERIKAALNDLDGASRMPGTAH